MTAAGGVIPRIGTFSVLAALALAGAVGACRPEKPDVLAARRAEAKKRAAAARAAVERGRETLSDPAKWIRELTPEQGAAVVATVGGRPITLGEVAKQIQGQPGYMQLRYALPAERQALVESMVDFELLVREAERLGYAQSPEVVLATRRAVAELAVEAAIDARVQGVVPEESEVRAYYDAHSEETTRPARERVSFILIEGEGRARALHAEIVAAAAAPGADPEAIFRERAIDHSYHETSRIQKGDLGWLTEERAKEGAILRAALGAARALAEVGQMSEPFKITPGSWGLVRLVDREPARRLSLDEARIDIVHKLVADQREAARQAIVAELRAAATVEVYDAVLAEVQPPAVPKAAPAPKESP